MERQRVYDKYIGIIGDTTFYQVKYPGITAIITPVSEIVITCDKKFSGEFPAGSNVSSLFSVYFDNIYATIKNGYNPVDNSYRPIHLGDFPISIFKANLAHADFPSLKFIGNLWECHLDVAPEYTDTYTFDVKVILVDGTTLEGVNPVSIAIKGQNEQNNYV